MRGARLKHTINLWLRLTSKQRMKYLKDHQVFASIGENCTYMGRRVPLYADLIKIGNNVRIATGVSFNCHDIIHLMLNNHPEYGKGNGYFYPEHIGCIEIGDNVFIGAGTSILYDVKIGSNVVIGIGSVVNKDIPDNSVVAGVPARFICSFDMLREKREAIEPLPDDLKIVKEAIPPKLAESMWHEFNEKHKG